MTIPDDQERDQRYREFVRLLAEHERRLTAYVHALIPLWQDAEDVLQNTKLRLWEQFDSFRPDGDFAAWAIVVATYMVRAHRTEDVPLTVEKRKAIPRNIITRSFVFRQVLFQEQDGPML